jgi:hypothetical protein
MRIPIEVVVLIVAQGLMGCDGRPAALPIAPSPTEVPVSLSAQTPGTAGQEQWKLTGTYIGHSGPEACISPVSVTAGQPVHSVLVIQRSGESVQFFTEHDHYIGSVVGDEFIANETQDPGGLWDCAAARIPFRFEGRVSGRFSPDGRSLTGEEAAVFMLESGETIKRRWAWIAAR